VLRPRPHPLLRSLWPLALIGLACPPAAETEAGCDCRPFEDCSDGDCVAKVCADEVECPVGSHCVNQRCQLEGCQDDADCPGGRCVEGGCYAYQCLEDAIRDCSTYCGAGEETCVGGVWRGCTAPQPRYESCGSDGGVVEDAAPQLDAAEPDVACAGQLCTSTGGLCVAGDLVAQCGVDGESCYSCEGSEPCIVYSCLAGGGCGEEDEQNGTLCGAGMECYNGDCCVDTLHDDCGSTCACNCGDFGSGYTACDGSCNLIFNGNCTQICVNVC